MPQTSDILLANTCERYTRADFTALRAYLNRLPLARIAELYYSEDDLEVLNCLTAKALQARLEDLRDGLVQRACDLNPHAAEGLREARKRHVWSKAAVDFLVWAGEQDLAVPKRSDPVSMWIKPRVAAVLKAEGAATLAELLALIQARGAHWWKPIPRLGAGKAERIQGWLKQHEASLGHLEIRSSVVASRAGVLLDPNAPVLVPLEKCRLPQALDGSAGSNRQSRFCLVSAGNDLEAIDCYLYKFRAQEKTERAYRKELERFLLWCIYERRKPMSSVLLEDCEAYKDFLAAPPAHWIGARTLRLSPDWKPFAGRPSAKSQGYAVQAIRSFFEWLVDVRYLAGNPWVTVADPAVAREILPLQIDKALSGALWKKLVGEAGILDELCAASAEQLRSRYRLRGAAARLSMPAQYRLVRAALLLLGDAGLRREEAAYATREHLKPVAGVPSLWELDVLGKRSKWRTVFLPGRAIAALEAHWADRRQDFGFGMQNLPLLSPLAAPPTRTARRKHVANDGSRKESGFSPDGLYQVIKTSLVRIAEDNTLLLDDRERTVLRRAGPHAFRHTFGTQAVANEVPLDVLQRVLGHASLQTTTIYVQAEKQRSIDELGKFFKKI